MLSKKGNNFTPQGHFIRSFFLKQKKENKDKTYIILLILIINNQ